MPAKKTQSKKLLGHSVWFWVAAVAAVVLVAFLVHTETFTDAMKVVTDWAEDVMSDNPVAGAAVFFLLSAVSAAIGFASSAILVPPASDVWGKPVTFLLLWSGWVLGVVLAYWIGSVARPLLARLGFTKKLDEFHKYLSKRSKFWVVLLFCLAVPSEIAGYLFGGMHYPFVKFVAAIGISEAVYAAGVIIAGESLVEANSGVLLLVGGALIAVAVGAGLLFQKIKE